MAKKNDYGLPDETLQLIAGSPDIFADGKYLQSRTSGLKPSDLINAIRAYGTGNPGFTQYANGPGPQSASARTINRGLFNPPKLSIPRASRPVTTLPGADTGTPTRPVSISALDWLGDYVEDTDTSDKGIAAVDTGKVVSPNILVGTTVTNDVTDDDTIVDGTGGAGTGGTGGSGTGGTGGTGTAGGTGSAGTGVTGVATTGTTGTSTTGTGDSLRDAITAAVDGSGASVDNSAAGLNTSSASNAAGLASMASQLSDTTKPGVPNVTLEVVGGPIALDGAGSTSQTFDYPELLSPEELRIYESWMDAQSGGGGGGGGKPMFDGSAANLAF